MKFEEIKTTAHYMNGATGSVDTGLSWIADFIDDVTAGNCKGEIDRIFAEWQGEPGLIEVVQDQDGDWVEVTA